MGDERIKKILVIRMSAIGDVILTLPVVDALGDRFAGAAIDYVTRREFAGLVRHHPRVRRVWEFDRQDGFAGLRAMTGLIARERYDLVVDLHYNLRSLYLRWRGGGAMRRAYRKWSVRRRLLARSGLRVNLLGHAPRVLDRYFTALEDFGIAREGRRPRLYLDEASRGEAGEALQEAGLSGTGRFLAVAPGASRPTKRWPVEGFIAAAGEAAGSNLTVAVLGDDKDREVAQRLVHGLSAAGTRAVDLTGRLSLLGSAAVIERAAALLTNDSGLMHVADALDVPIVAVFGPTSRELGFFPSGPRTRVVERTGLRCRPCSLHGDQSCPQGHHACMLELAPDEVAAAVGEVMDRRP